MLGALAGARPVRADDAGTKPPVVVRGSDAAARSDPVYYRGRRNPTTALDVLAWVPRVVFFPLYFLTDVVLRRPLYALAEWLDEDDVVRWLRYRLFQPTPDFTWFPTFWVDLGVPASVGLELHWRRMFTKRDELGLVASTGGLYFWHFGASERFDVGPAYFGARGDYVTRNDRAFFGLGPYTGTTETHFRETRYEADTFVGLAHRNHVDVELSQGFRGERSGPGDAPSIETHFAPSTVPGFGEPIDLSVTRARVVVDSRASREVGGGARLDAQASYARDVERGTRSFVSTTVDARVAAEVSKPDRVLSLRGYLVDNVPLGSDPVPFTDQAMLGYDNHLGFIWGRFRGESAVMAEVQYRYPVAYFIDALWTVSSGNVFSHDFSNFDVGAFTTSFAFGFRTRGIGFSPFEVTLALGTTRFDQAFAIDSVRVYAGVWEGP